MNDRPSAIELLGAARGFMQSELIPQLTDGRLRFQALVAANVLAIVERELQAGDALRIKECELLCAMLRSPESQGDSNAWDDDLSRLNELLCERIRKGEFDEPSQFTALLDQLTTVVGWKLQVANPRYLSTTRADDIGSHTK
jgi:hypothetical protein